MTAHGRHTAVTVNSEDISEFTNTSEITESTDSHDTTTYGASAHRYAGGLTDGTFTMGGFFDSTQTTGPDSILRAVKDGNVPVTITRQLEGVGSGLPQESFSGLLTSYAKTAPVADMITWTAEFQISGPVDGTEQSA